MDQTSVFGALAFLFSAGAYVPYVKSVLESKTRPTISSWISWGLMDAAILAGMIAADTIAWQMAAYVTGVICVLGASVYRGAAVGWSGLDTACVAVVAMAVVLWGVSGDPVLAIVFGLVAALVGTVPFIRNIWNNPERESMLPWAMALAGSAFGVSAIPRWDIAGAAVPTVFLLIQIAIVCLIYRKFYPRNASA